MSPAPRPAESARTVGRTLRLLWRVGPLEVATLVLLRDGRLVEDGTHNELLAQGGEYAGLWRLQAGRYESV